MQALCHLLDDFSLLFRQLLEVLETLGPLVAFLSVFWNSYSLFCGVRFLQTFLWDLGNEGKRRLGLILLSGAIPFFLNSLGSSLEAKDNFAKNLWKTEKNLVSLVGNIIDMYLLNQPYYQIFYILI